MLAVTPAYQHLPFVLPFTFDDAAQNTSYAREVLCPYNLAAYAISIRSSRNITTSFYVYSIEFQNFHTGETLMDEPIQNLNIESDCRLLFQLPSKWYLEKNHKIICRINMLDDSATTDLWVNLLCTTEGSHPNPGRSPFIYGFPSTIGFQDNNAGVQTSIPFGMVPTGTVAKNALYDFELESFTLDVSGDAGLSAFPNFAFQFSLDCGYRKFFDRPVLNGLAGGGVLYQQGVPGTGATITGYPNNQVVRWRLPRPEFIKRGTLMRLDVYPSPTYVSATNIPIVLIEKCNFAAIGTHIYNG